MDPKDTNEVRPTDGVEHLEHTINDIDPAHDAFENEGGRAHEPDEPRIVSK